MREYRRKVVRISPLLLHDMLTVGTAVCIQCTEGLPVDAEFIGMSYDSARDCYALCFQSASWQLVSYGEQLPEQRITFTRCPVSEEVSA